MANTASKIREMPIGSTLCAAWGAVAFADMAAFIDSDLFASGALFVSPMLCAALAVPATIDLLSNDRTSLSKTFAFAAMTTGAIGAAAPFLTSGPEALGALFISMLAMSVAGTLNVASYLARNAEIPWSVKLQKKDTTKDKKPPTEQEPKAP